MDLSMLLEYYREETNVPLPLGMYLNHGWSENAILSYLSHIEVLRSAMILLSDRESPIRRGAPRTVPSKLYREIVGSAFDSLMMFLQLRCDQLLDFSNLRQWYIEYGFKLIRYEGQRRHILDVGDDDEANCWLVYRSVDHLRLMLEKDLHHCLTKGDLAPGITFSRDWQDMKSLPQNPDTLNRTLSHLEDLMDDLEASQQPLDPSSYHTIQLWASSESDRQSNIEDTQDKIEDCEDMLDLVESASYTNKKVLYVHKGSNIRCQVQHHRILSVTADLTSVTGQDIQINANYCADCNKFFISKVEYDYYRGKYPGLLANFRFIENDFNESPHIERETYSLLALNGYSVKKGGPSEQTRRQILTCLMETGIMEKYQIINHLEMLINTNGAKTGMYAATQKWEDDLSFVRCYGIADQPVHKIDDIQKY